MTSEQLDEAREERLNEAVAAYYEALEVGKKPSRDEFAARYPDLTEELNSFFADKERFDRLAEPLPPLKATAPGEQPTLAPGETMIAPGLGTVRYFGDYELLEEVARGGMGVVYKARQVSLNRTVALKMILAGHLASAADVQRFQTEAEAAANLDHPNIVPIYEVGEHRGQHYFSMKLIEGENLAAFIQQNADYADERRENLRKSAQSAFAMFAKVVRAVHYAHQRGILHRDLKPANIL